MTCAVAALVLGWLMVAVDVQAVPPESVGVEGWIVIGRIENGHSCMSLPRVEQETTIATLGRVADQGS